MLVGQLFVFMGQLQASYDVRPQHDWLKGGERHLPSDCSARGRCSDRGGSLPGFAVDWPPAFVLRKGSPQVWCWC